MLIGREKELEVIGEAFLAGHSLVTLTGPGGIGKTRLARELMRASQAARFVDLVGAASPAALGDAVGAALGLPRGADVDTALAEQSSLLVVMDDFDALLPAGAATLERWLERAPEVAWLVTSRTRLGLADERVIELGGLGLPDRDLEASAALALFRQRAELGGAKLEARDLPYAAELMVELGGFPLAIELAASRLGVMNVRALLHRVRSDPRVLARSTGPERHRSLEAAFASSWAALSPAEQRGLSALSVFAGSFTLEAAEAVLGEVIADADPLAIVQRLRDGSLLSSHDDARLALPPVLRELARGEDRERALSAHARYFIRWAEEHPGEAATESRNLMAIVDRVAQHDAPADRAAAEDALSALWALAPADRARLPLAQCLEAIAPVLERSQASGADPHLFARGLLLRGEATWRAQGSDAAVRDLARARDMALQLDDAGLDLAARRALAEVAIERERFDDARALLAGPDAPGIEALEATLAARENDARAAALLERAAVRFEARGARESAALMRLQLALFELDHGRHDPARRHAEAVASSPETSRATAARAGAVLGRIAQDRGQLEEAATLLEAAAAELRALGLPGEAAEVTLHAGMVACEARRSALAHVLLTDALAGLGQKNARDRAFACVQLSELEREAGDEAAAERQREAALAAHAAQARRLVDASADELVASEDARLRAFGRSAQRAGGHAALPDDALLIASDGSWFRPPHSARVSLARRRPLARLLCKLAGSGEATREELIDAGWPGERILPDAALHRVRVAISTLRKLGLGDALVTTDDGYRLGSRSIVD